MEGLLWRLTPFEEEVINKNYANRELLRTVMDGQIKSFCINFVTRRVSK
jgi:hypothetical protein